MQANDQPHALAAVFPVETTMVPTEWKTWVVPGVNVNVLGGEKSLCPCRESNPSSCLSLVTRQSELQPLWVWNNFGERILICTDLL